MSRRRKLITVLVLVLLVVPGVAIASLPRSFVEVDSGKFGGSHWRFRVGGGHGERCIELRLSGRSSGYSKGAVCDQGIPMHWHWQMVFGVGGGNGNFPTVQLGISSPRVSRVNLLLGHPGRHRPANWHSYELRSITRSEAHRAHLKRDFHYAVLTGMGFLCVKKVRAFDRFGDLVERRSLHCEN